MIIQTRNSFSDAKYKLCDFFLRDQFQNLESYIIIKRGLNNSQREI